MKKILMVGMLAVLVGLTFYTRQASAVSQQTTSVLAGYATLVTPLNIIYHDSKKDGASFLSDANTGLSASNLEFGTVIRNTEAYATVGVRVTGGAEGATMYLSLAGTDYTAGVFTLTNAANNTDTIAVNVYLTAGGAPADTAALKAGVQSMSTAISTLGGVENVEASLSGWIPVTEIPSTGKVSGIYQGSMTVEAKTA